MKYTEAVEAARKVLVLEPDNAKAKDILEAAEQKLGEARAADEEVTSAPAEEPKTVKKPEAAKPEKAPAEKPAAAESGDVEQLRNDAMELFNTEDYAAAEEAWKKLLKIAPDDKQAQEMLETTQMLIEALK